MKYLSTLQILRLHFQGLLYFLQICIDVFNIICWAQNKNLLFVNFLPIIAFGNHSKLKSLKNNPK